MASASSISIENDRYQYLCSHCGVTHTFHTFQEAFEHDCTCLSDAVATEITEGMGYPDAFYTEEYTLRGAGYKDQDGCHNCAYHYLYEEVDDQDIIYCTINGDLRPEDTSTVACVERTINNIPEPDFKESNEAWNKWILGREVVGWGICSGWVKEVKHENE